MAFKKNEPRKITDAERIYGEEQIRKTKQPVDYQTKEFTIEVLVKKFLDGKDEDENEIFIPTYQRSFVWSNERRSKFIESVLLELPIPPLFIANLEKSVLDDFGRAEIVDGSQRIRTLADFINNQLTLESLPKLNALNGHQFKDLELSRRRKILRQGVRVIELSDKANEEVRRDIFERINTGSDELRDMEKRRGIYTGPFYDFIKECAQNDNFKRICPISFAKERREEAEELVLRYFAYCDTYLSFKHDVRKFLDGYLKKHQTNFPKERMKREFLEMLSFAEAALPYGFRKAKDSSTVPRVRFEALACGMTLAQRVKQPLTATSDQIQKWLDSAEFKVHTASDASNSLPRLRGRIEFVRNKLLG